VSSPPPPPCVGSFLALSIHGLPYVIPTSHCHPHQGPAPRCKEAGFTGNLEFHVMETPTRR